MTCDKRSVLVDGSGTPTTVGPPQGQPTIYDVARAAGVSIASVIIE